MQRLKADFEANGGKFKEHRIGDLFEIKGNPQLNKESFVFSDKAKYPYFTRTVFNNGILGYVEYLDEEHLIKGNSLAVGMLGMQFFYMDHDFYAGQFTKTAFPKFDFNEKIALYFISIFNRLQKMLQGVLVRDFEKTFCSQMISLPTKTDGNIDFDYMQMYIAQLEAERVAQLEAERVAQLEAYLKAAGLESASLTEKEQKALTAFRNGEIKFSSFRIGDLFNVVGTKSLDEGKLKFVSDGVNFVGRVFENNGVKGKISKQTFTPNEKNTITATVIGNYKYVKFQQEEYYCSQNINKLLPQFEINEKNALYFMTPIQKFVSIYDGQQGGYKLPELTLHEITLPVLQDGNIAFEFMETFVSAQQKLVIKDVIAWKNKVIHETQNLVNS